MSKSIEVVKVPFHGQEISAFYDGQDVYVGVRSICENVGIDYSSQKAKLKSHRHLSKGVAMITTPSIGGEQETLCLKLKSLPMWLITINPAKVAESVSEKLERYQDEAEEVLANHFFGRERSIQSFDAVPQSPEEQMLHMSRAALAQAEYIVEVNKKVVENERRVNQIEATIKRQEVEREEAKQMLLALPPASVEEIPDIPLNKEIHRVIGAAYRTGSGMHPQAAFSYLYDQLKLRYGIDLRARARNREDRAKANNERRKKYSPMDIAIEQGHTQKLYDLAVKLLQKSTPAQII